MLSNGSALTARPRGRPPRREFVTTICTEDLGRYAGVGLTLDQVIEEELRHVGVTPVAAAEECDDLVIWEGNKVVALIRIGPDQRPVITRFDPPAAHAAGPGTDDASHPGETNSPRALVLKETRGAIAHFLAMRRCAEEALERHQEVVRTRDFVSQPEWDQSTWELWVNLAREAALLSERHLFRCILVLNGKVKSLSDLDAPGFRRPPCGVILDDRLYLAPGSEAGAATVVVELRDVARLDPNGGDAPPRED